MRLVRTRIHPLSIHPSIPVYIYMYIYGVASKFGYGSARGDPNVWIGLDHLRFGSGVWIGLRVQGMDWGFTF